MIVSYDIVSIVCINLPCVSECMCDVRHDIQIACTPYVAMNRLYLYIVKANSGMERQTGQTCETVEGLVLPRRTEQREKTRGGTFMLRMSGDSVVDGDI